MDSVKGFFGFGTSKEYQPPIHRQPSGPAQQAPASAGRRLELPDGILALLNQAIENDEKENYKEAYLGYKEALGKLMQVIKHEKDEQVRARLRARMYSYLTRAEELQAYCPPQLRGGASSGGRPSDPSPASSSSVEPNIRLAIEGEIVCLDQGPSFDTIIGLESVKQALREMVILPALRPDIFSGLRVPTRGLLLYGPPGNGKTFVASALATEANAIFFNISASSLVSKHFGEAEKLVRGLFTIARERAPSIVFVDEIDSLLSKRSSQEHEASRRLKTEFLVQFDGLLAKSNDASTAHVVVIGATNLAGQIDDAMIRRLPKRIYVGPPDANARAQLITSLLQASTHRITRAALAKIVAATQGYSCSDVQALCQEASMGPVRALGPSLLLAPLSELQPIGAGDFEQALRVVRPAIDSERLQQYQAMEQRWAAH